MAGFGEGEVDVEAAAVVGLGDGDVEGDAVHDGEVQLEASVVCTGLDGRETKPDASTKFEARIFLSEEMFSSMLQLGSKRTVCEHVALLYLSLIHISEPTRPY